MVNYDENKIKELKEVWKSEEDIAHIHGWDFSHISERYEEENELPWDYKKIIFEYLKKDMKLLDIDTGGGEFLCSLGHGVHNISATEGYPPNVEICKETLIPMGIDFKEASDYKNLPFENDTFDIIINRHGNYNAEELYRILKPNGIFITQQVGEDNDRDMVKFLIGNVKKNFEGANLTEQKAVFEKAGFEIMYSDEAFNPIKFYDIGALVWFARIISWEFVDFSVDRCFEKLLEAQKILDEKGVFEGTTHRYVIVSRKLA